MRYLFLLLTTVILSSCANWDVRNDKMAATFHGKHVDEAIKYFGVPTGRTRLSDGAQVIEFITYKVGYQCWDQFTTNQNGIIVSSRHGGQNGCAMSGDL